MASKPSKVCISDPDGRWKAVQEKSLKERFGKVGDDFWNEGPARVWRDCQARAAAFGLPVAVLE